MAVIIKGNGCTDFTELICEMAELPEGNYNTTITKCRRPRTGQQNKYLWGVVYPLLHKGLIEAGYTFAIVEEVHDFCKSVFNLRTVNKHTGEIIEIPDSTKEMDVVVFSTYIQIIREWASEYLYLEIPDPIK